MLTLVELPDDILIAILRHFIHYSTVEDLIRLETVCRRLRQVCHARTCWVDALETLGSRPPFVASRASLLGLADADLRDEIIRAVKLDRFWASESSPGDKLQDTDFKTVEISIPVTAASADRGHRLDEPASILPVPEVDLIFATYLWNGVCCWSISQKRLVWELFVAPEEGGREREQYTLLKTRSNNLKLACEVLDDSSTVRVALHYISDKRGQRRVIEVHELHARLFHQTQTLVFKSSPMTGSSVDEHDMRLRDDYVVLKLVHEDPQICGYIVVNWRDATFYRIREEALSYFSPFALTRDAMFFVCQTRHRSYRLVGVRHRYLLGSSSSKHDEWPAYDVKYLEAHGVYSDMLLPYWSPHFLAMHVTVSTWSRSPSTRLTITLNRLNRPSRPGTVDIFDVAFKFAPGLVPAADGTHGQGQGQGHSGFTMLASCTALSDMVITSAPAVAMRALVRTQADADATFNYARGPAACYFPSREARDAGAGADADADDDSEAEVVPVTVRERIRLLESSAGKPVNLLNTYVQMDPLGRVVAYHSAAGGITVIRFDAQ